MTGDEMKKLQPGTLIRHKSRSDALVVTANYGDRVTAVRIHDVTNPAEWDVLSRQEPNQHEAAIAEITTFDWRPPETAPKDGKVFVTTTAGPNMDLCVWVPERSRFEDYFYKQNIAPMWPYMVAWAPMGDPAVVGNTVEESRTANGFSPKP